MERDWPGWPIVIILACLQIGLYTQPAAYYDARVFMPAPAPPPPAPATRSRAAPPPPAPAALQLGGSRDLQTLFASTVVSTAVWNLAVTTLLIGSCYDPVALVPRSACRVLLKAATKPRSFQLDIISATSAWYLVEPGLANRGRLENRWWYGAWPVNRHSIRSLHHLAKLFSGCVIDANHHAYANLTPEPPETVITRLPAYNGIRRFLGWRHGTTRG